MIRLIHLLLPLLLLTCPASADDAAARLAQLRAVMTERPAIMDGVARFKWNEHLPSGRSPLTAGIKAWPASAFG